MEQKELGMNDHDLLITIHEQVRAMRLDIQNMQDGTSKTLGDHEARLRILERWSWKAIGAIAILQAAITVYLVIKKP